MIRALKIAAVSGLIGLLASCTGGGGNGDTTPPGEELALLLFAISPSSGTAPLQATLTAVVSGGTAPYDFAWDFENDGSFDAFTNDTFDTTVSRNTVYNLRAADAGPTSVYQAIVRVTDAAGKVVTSDPRSVTVSSQDAGIGIDPSEAFIEDELGNEIDTGSQVLSNGQRVRFHFGDRSGLQYQWDFEFQTIDISKPLDQQVSPLNPIFTVDSTQVSPQHVYHNTGTGPLVYIAKVRVKDPATGETAEHVFSISVAGTTPPGTDRTLVGNIFSDPAADASGVITLRFDPTGNTPGVPAEPKLELSGVVSDLPAERGDPPYEFYWDYENDGKVDKAAPAATVPYYDAARKVTVNPYLHTEDERLFTVRLLVVDILGRTDEVVRTIRSLNVGNRPPAALNFTLNWGFDHSGTLRPYVQVAGPNDGQTGTFSLVPRGGTEIYEFKIDIDGDGLGDLDYVDTNADTVPDTVVVSPGADAWIPVTTAGTTVNVAFGPHGDPATNEFPLPMYYAAAVIVRALDAPGGNQVDVMTRQAPLSLVQVGAVDESLVPLPAVQDHAMTGFAIDTTGFTRSVLDIRGVVITGGAQGTTALRGVVRVTESFTPPADEADPETSNGFAVDTLTPLTVARRGHAGFVTRDDPDGYFAHPNSVVYAIGGRNPADGALSSTEFMPLSTTATDMPWLLLGSEMLRPGGRYPLFDFGQAMAAPGGAWFTGGLHQPAPSVNATVSARRFGLSVGTWGDPADDSWVTTGAGLAVPRYDLNTVIIGDTMYAIGGRGSGGQSTATVEKFTFGVDTAWVQLPNLRDARAGACAEVIDPDGPGGPLPAQIYVYGGAFFPTQSGSRTLVTTAEVFNPATGTWSYTLPPEAPSYAAASARLPWPGYTDGSSASNNTVWYYGGEIGATVSAGETNNIQEFIYFNLIQ